MSTPSNAATQTTALPMVDMEKCGKLITALSSSSSTDSEAILKQFASLVGNNILDLLRNTTWWTHLPPNVQANIQERFKKGLVSQATEIVKAAEAPIACPTTQYRMTPGSTSVAQERKEGILKEVFAIAEYMGTQSALHVSDSLEQLEGALLRWRSDKEEHDQKKQYVLDKIQETSGAPVTLNRRRILNTASQKDTLRVLKETLDWWREWNSGKDDQYEALRLRASAPETVQFETTSPPEELVHPSTDPATPSAPIPRSKEVLAAEAKAWQDTLVKMNTAVATYIDTSSKLLNEVDELSKLFTENPWFDPSIPDYVDNLKQIMLLNVHTGIKLRERTAKARSNAFEQRYGFSSECIMAPATWKTTEVRFFSS